MKRSAVVILLLAFLSGCVSWKGSEFHQTISFPGFKDEIHATGVEKTANPDGTSTYKASQLSHGLSVLGFSRDVTYKDAEITVKEKQP